MAQADIPVYNYSVPGFYGFRGEYPGRQQFDRSDFSGYALWGQSVSKKCGIKCGGSVGTKCGS